jgi:nucleotidyltransferase/DNA polymerase involved in DNA repair
MQEDRVIIHVDLDCFFVQVHIQKDKSLQGIPIAIQQHDDIICVSYEARNKIEKHEKPSIALEKLPGLKLVHVEKLEGTSKVTYRAYREQSVSIFKELQSFVSKSNTRARIGQCNYAC